MKHLSVSALRLKLWSKIHFIESSVSSHSFMWDFCLVCETFPKCSASPKEMDLIKSLFVEMFLYLNHEPVIEIIDLCQNIPFQILCGGFQIEKFSCHFIFLIWKISGRSCLLYSSILIEMIIRVLCIFFLHQSCFQKWNVVVKVGRNAGVFQVWGGCSEMHPDRRTLLCYLETLVWTKTLWLTEKLILCLGRGFWYDFRTAIVLCELFSAKHEIKRRRFVEHHLFRCSSFICYSSPLECFKIEIEIRRLMNEPE